MFYLCMCKRSTVASNLSYFDSVGRHQSTISTCEPCACMEDRRTQEKAAFHAERALAQLKVLQSSFICSAVDAQSMHYY